MTRSLRIAVAVVALALLAFGAYAWSRRVPAFVLDRNADVNVVLVTIDTLRADALSSYGGPAQTPHLDALAAHGARFTFAHAHSVVTLPSHTTILSGQLPYEHGIRDNSGFRVKDGTPTLATWLKAAGYQTGAFVAGFPLTKRFGLTPGFDEYDDQMPEMHGALAISLPERPADAVVSSAVKWIEGRERSKFFAWVHVFDPHSPYKPPEDLAAAYAAKPYYGEVAFVDRELGRLFASLKSAARPTIVIVTADHGESLGEHGEQTHGMFAYDATLRVPLIVARIGPPTETSEASGRGTVIDSPVRLVDIAPTVLDIVGHPSGISMAGTSLVDVISAGSGEDRPAYFEAMTYNLVRGWAPLRGVINGRAKYIDLPIPELYDLASDAAEQHNTAPAQSGRVRELHSLLRTYNVAPPNRPGQESAEAAAVLRSLGYVSGSAAPRDLYTEADDPKRLVDVDRDLHAATAAFENGQHDRGVELLESVIARRGDTADAYISLAFAEWEAGRVDAAIAALERGLRNGAPDRDIRIRLGVYLAESGANSSRAIALLEGLPATDAEAQNGLGVALTHAGRLGDAARAFRRVLVLDPTNGLALQNLASLSLRQALAVRAEPERQSLLREAEALAERAIAADPLLPDVYTTMGVIYSSTGRPDRAIASWKRAVTLDAAQFNALYNLWAKLGETGPEAEAIQYGKQFVANAPPALFSQDIVRVRAWLAQRRAKR